MKLFYSTCAILFVLGAFLIATDVFEITQEANRGLAYRGGIILCFVAAIQVCVVKPCIDRLSRNEKTR